MEHRSSKARVVAVCISENRGTKKSSVRQGRLEKNFGLIGDAHADSNSHRQVSLLAMESVRKMEEKGLKAVPGIFAENITTEGIELLSMKPGSQILVGDEAVLEITQIGKKCHSGCEIFTQIGDCIMPREGLFTRVISGGIVKENDTIKILTEPSLKDDAD